MNPGLILLLVAVSFMLCVWYWDRIVRRLRPLWLRGLPAHDPMNWRQSKTSGPWNTDTFCENCKCWTEHKDIMSGICHNCGSRKGVRNYRSARWIWDGTRIRVQFKYNDSANGYEIK
jgi:uncharacterized paraquat-inducible protein A